MFNLLKAEWFKLWRSRPLWIIIALIFALFFTFVLFTYLADIGVLDETGSVRVEVNESVTEEAPLSGIKLLIESAYGPDLFSIILIISFLGAFFLTSENSIGTIKNVVATGHHRWQIYLAKMLALMFGSLILSVFFMLIPAVIGSISFGIGEWPNTDMLINTLKILLISWLYYFAFASIVTVFAMISKGTGVASLLSIGYYLLAGPGLNFIGAKYAIFDKISVYSVYNMFYKVGERVFEQASLLAVIITPIITIIGFTVIGILLFQRKDIQ